MDKPAFNTNYRELKEHLTILSAEDLQHIEDKAKILPLNECFTWLGVDAQNLTPIELDFSTRAHARGALDAIHVAAKALFLNMKTRNGALAALEYLKATSGQFAVTATPNSPNKGGGFNFSVTLQSEDDNVTASEPKSTDDKEPPSGKPTTQLRGIK